jgi:hypothetical protein
VIDGITHIQGRFWTRYAIAGCNEMMSLVGCCVGPHKDLIMLPIIKSNKICVQNSWRSASPSTEHIIRTTTHTQNHHWSLMLHQHINWLVVFHCGQTQQSPSSQFYNNRVAYCWVCWWQQKIFCVSEIAAKCKVLIWQWNWRDVSVPNRWIRTRQPPSATTVFPR